MVQPKTLTLPDATIRQDTCECGHMRRMYKAWFRRLYRMECNHCGRCGPYLVPTMRELVEVDSLSPRRAPVRPSMTMKEPRRYRGEWGNVQPRAGEDPGTPPPEPSDDSEPLLGRAPLLYDGVLTFHSLRPLTRAGKTYWYDRDGNLTKITWVENTGLNPGRPAYSGYRVQVIEDPTRHMTYDQMLTKNRQAEAGYDFKPGATTRAKDQDYSANSAAGASPKSIGPDAGPAPRKK